jgi:large subunit ribosomal protein LP1
VYLNGALHLSLPVQAASYPSFSSANSTNIQGEKITTLTSAANVEVEAIWASLLAKALDGKDVKELLTNVGAPAAAAGGDAPAEEKAEEKKEEAKEESDDDMVCPPSLSQRARTNVIGLRSIRLIDSIISLLVIKNSLDIYACTGPSMHVAVPSTVSCTVWVIITNGVLIMC